MMTAERDRSLNTALAEQRANSDIAIIGAGGFVGSRLTESLVLAGHAGIHAVVRSYRNTAGLCRFGSSIDVRRANAEEMLSLSEALAGVHTVVNVTTGAPAAIVRSTSAIYTACVRAGVSRFVHLSSAVVYGDVLTPLGDDDPPVAKHWMPYARAKGAAEVWLRERLPSDKLDVVVLRPGIVWGVRSPHTMEFAKALCGKSTYLVDGGRGIFNGIYIDNLVACILAACGHPGHAAGFYNVGDRETVRWQEFFGALGEPLGCDPSRLPQVSGDRFPRSVSSTIETLQALPPVNELYHRLKTRIPDGVKAGIKARLEGDYRYDRVAAAYSDAVPVDRELWHLQRVRHKLPIEKFGRTFAFEPPVSFPDGIRKTIAWLQTLGMVPSSYSVSK
jgi:nucleoside-diphosphate-sugar epimerase